MAKLISFLFILTFFILSLICPIHGKTSNIICYYQSWATYQGVQPEDININICTHINYAFVSLNDDGSIKSMDKDLDIDKGFFKKVTGLKSKNSNLKVLLSVGGGRAGMHELFVNMASNAGRRATFIKSCNEFMTKYNFNGIDLDWEVPEAKDRDNFATLVREMRQNFGNKYLLTSAVKAIPVDGYNVPELMKHFDWINIMAYDFYGYWKSKYTGPNSALFPSSLENETEKDRLNIAASIRHWKEAGATVNKLAMGVAFYGRSFVLQDPKNHGLHAPITDKPGILDGGVNFIDVCANLNNGWTRVWDDEQKGPYKYKDNQWFSYDDTRSIGDKADYIQQQGLGGIMIWPIDGDDVHGKCGPKAPLLARIKEVLG